MTLRWLIACALACALLSGSAQADDLAPDEVEAFVEELGPWLAEFESWLEGADGSPFADASKLSAPPAAGDDDITHGRYAIRRTARSAEPVTLDPKAWRQRVLVGDWGGVDVASKTKVIGVSLDDVGACSVRMRVELRDGDAPGTSSRQCVGEVTVTIERGDDLRCVGAALSTADYVALPKPAFVERTASLLARNAEAAGILGVGLDRWAQRLDDPSLSAWFGHQGLAVGDVDGDGWDDLYVAMPSGIANMLLVRREDGTLRDVANALGVAWLDDTKGCLLIDMDGDGDDDVVTTLGHVIVIQSNPGLGPGDKLKAFPVSGWCVAPDEAPFYSIAAADLDGDRDLEIYGTRYVRTHYADTLPIPLEDARNGPSNHLYRNDGDRFVDVTEAMGLVSEGGERFSLAASFVDIDGDLDQDLYVANDFGRNQMFVREGDRFVERANALGIEDQGAGMGCSFGDVNQDGKPDLYVTNMYSSAGRRVAFREGFGDGRDAAQLDGIRRLSLGNSLFVSRDGGFDEVTETAGVEMGRWGWGAIFTDLDADGRDDLMAPSGFLTGPKPGDL